CVTGGANDDAAREALFAERVVNELEHLATTLADQADDDDLRGALPRDLSHQGRFTDAGAGEETDTLSAPYGEQTGPSAHAEGDDAVDGLTRVRVWCLALDGPRLEAFDVVERGEAVDRIADARERATEQAVTAADGERLSRRD